MNATLKDQTAIITGAGRGIGRAIALGCARAGARVVLAARTEADLQETARAIDNESGRALVVPTDVTEPAQVHRLVEYTEDQLGPVDLLVNNAGRLAAMGPLWQVDPNSWWDDVKVNLWGVFLCCREVLPGMIQRGRGRIINMVGGGTPGPFPYASGYGCSKAAVMRLTDTLAEELRKATPGVQVFALTPGFVRTTMTEQFAKTEAGRAWLSDLAERLQEGEDVPPQRAAAMVVALASGQLDRLHGRYFHSARDLDHLEQLPEQADEIISQNRRTLGIR